MNDLSTCKITGWKNCCTVDAKDTAIYVSPNYMYTVTLKLTKCCTVYVLFQLNQSMTMLLYLFSSVVIGGTV